MATEEYFGSDVWTNQVHKTAYCLCRRRLEHYWGSQ